MPNRNQLRILTDDQATAIRAAGNGLAVAEIVKIHWPAPDGPIAYAWWNLLDDPLYAGSNLADWLDGAPLITAFVAADEAKIERFHEIPRTAQIGDDVVRMRFQNRGRAFENLAYTQRGGVKVEIFYFYPQIEDGLALNWFSGHLRMPDKADDDFVEITVAAGLRSPDLLVPNRLHAGQCTWAAQFGGRFDPVLPNNPCDYDVHVGGDRGVPGFTSCPGAKSDCMARLGDLESYGGFDAVTDTQAIGSGRHTTVSETQGQTTRLKEPVQVCYGEGTLNNLPLLDFAKEYNPSDKHADKGTIRALYEISEGPIEEVTEFEMMDVTLPRVDGQGLEVRLGTQRQEPTTYSANVLNYNRLAHARADNNPTNPTGVQPSQIVAKCNYRGRNTVRVYSDPETYEEAYTQLRAWAALDLLTDTVYGHREDVARHSLPDFIHLAEVGSTFNGVVQGKSAHQQFTDICLAGKWFLPFNHNGITRWLALEEYDLDDPDIPEFTDAGPNRNILKDERGVSRLEWRAKDDDQIPNEITLLINDKEHKNLERPLLFPDEEQQKRAGLVYGDGSLRKVPQSYTAFGINTVAEARPIGWYLLDYGPFYSGGSKNNCEVTFVGSLLRSPEYLDLHENKVIKLTSDKLENAKDRDGNVFTHFIVKSLTATPRGELIVVAQAYAALRPPEEGGGETECGQVVWECATNWTVTPGELGSALEMTGGRDGFSTAYAQSEQTLTTAGQAFKWRVFRPGVEQEVGVTAEDCPPCIPVSEIPGVRPAYCYWSVAVIPWQFYYGLDEIPEIPDSSEDQAWIFYVDEHINEVAGPFVYTASTVFEIRRTATGLDFVIDDEVVHTFTEGIPATLRLAALGGTARFAEPSAPVVSKALFCEPGGSLPGADPTTGGTGITQTPAESRWVTLDRFWREQEQDAGLPGFYVAAGPETVTGAWPAFELWRDKGAGWEQLSENAEAAILGVAVTVLGSDTLLDDETGNELIDDETGNPLGEPGSVQVELLPGQSLLSYTAAQVAAGAGLIWLGGEILQYQTATQLKIDPNEWELTELSNRGAKCTTAFQTTHEIGEDFVLLETATVRFVQLAASELGVTRNYKGLTAGQELAEVDARALTINCPNLTITTPTDYAVSCDPLRREVIHTWTPVGETCSVLSGLVYEIWSDDDGPAELLWSGTPHEWRQALNLEGTFTFHLRARADFSMDGAYVEATVVVDYSAGTYLISDATGDYLGEDAGGALIVEDE